MQHKIVNGNEYTMQLLILLFFAVRMISFHNLYASLLWIPAIYYNNSHFQSHSTNLILHKCDYDYLMRLVQRNQHVVKYEK